MSLVGKDPIVSILSNFIFLKTPEVLIPFFCCGYTDYHGAQKSFDPRFENYEWDAINDSND